MFLINEIEAIVESAEFAADYRAVVQGLASARLQIEFPVPNEVCARLDYLVQAVLASAPDWNPDARSGLCRKAAEIAELVAHRSTIERTAARLRLRSALLYEMAGMPAMSAGVVRPQDLQSAVWDFLASRGRFQTLTAAGAAHSVQRARAEPREIDQDALALLDVDLDLLADYEHGRRDQFRSVNSPVLSALAGRLSLGFTATDFKALEYVMLLHRERSVRDNIPPDLFSKLQRYRFPPVLFPAQVEAIRAGLLDPVHLGWGFAAPTGTGKTYLTRLLILDALRENRGQAVIYLVPTRALVHEVTAALDSFFSSDGVIVSAVTPQLVALDAGESEQLDETDVVVLTPEKADLLLRLGGTIMDRAALVIVDEAHHLESGTRGALLELYLLRLKQIVNPRPRVVLLSAVAPNIRELAAWAGGEAAGKTVSQRSTRMRAGVFRYRKSGRHREGWIHYSDGSEVPVVTGSVESGVRRQLAQVAEALSAAGPVLIVAKGKKECEILAETLLTFQEENGFLRYLTPEEEELHFVQRLDSRLAREMYADVPMRRLIRHRVAYHHAGLPPRVRVAVEQAIRARVVDFVFATTTLAEGVNFPFATVIVQALALRDPPEKGRPARYHPVTPRSFWNIAGRAGRPGVDREGQAILFEPTLGLEKVNAVLDPYLDPSLMNLNPVQSALGSALDNIRAGVEKGELSLDQLDREVLPEQLPRAVHGAINLVRIALVHGATAAQLSPEEIVSETLAFRQASHEAQRFARSVFDGQRRVLDRFFADPSAPPPEIVAELGLSIDTLTQLRDYGRQLEDWQVQNFGGVMHGGNADLEKSVYVLGPVAKRMSELEGRVLGGIYGEVATLWLSGIPLSDVRRRAEGYSARRLEDLISVIYSRVQFLLPWGLYAFDRIIEEEAKRRSLPYNSEIRLLAYLADAGVPTFDALRLVNLDFERVDATRLAREYRRMGGLNQDVDILGWLKTQPRERLFRILRGPDNRELDYDINELLTRFE